jgi:hypothetical protein
MASMHAASRGLCADIEFPVSGRSLLPQYVAVQYTHGVICDGWESNESRPAYASFDDVALLALFAALLLAGIWGLVALIVFLWRHF